MTNDWLVTLKFKDMVVPAQHIDWPEPVDIPAQPANAEGMQELIQAFIGGVQDIEIEIVKIEQVSE